MPDHAGWDWGKQANLSSLASMCDFTPVATDIIEDSVVKRLLSCTLHVTASRWHLQNPNSFHYQWIAVSVQKGIPDMFHQPSKCNSILDSISIWHVKTVQCRSICISAVGFPDTHLIHFSFKSYILSSCQHLRLNIITLIVYSTWTTQSPFHMAL